MVNKKDRIKDNQVRKKDPIQSALVLIICGILTLTILVGTRIAGFVRQDQVYAASDTITLGPGDRQLPSGIAGVVSVISSTPAPGAAIKRIGTSCEDVLVGQRVGRIKNLTTKIDLSSSMKSQVDIFNSAALDLASNPKIMSDEDYDSLLRIVEAEAGTEDLKGRILIANVIMNRVNHPEFPKTISNVIWEVRNGVPQFSPTYDGSIYTVSISDETREAVKQAMEGKDYSQGALFFIQRNVADKDNISWFDKELKKLFKHGVHEFYKYPEETKNS